MSVASALDRRETHYGWVVIGITFLTLLTTAGAMSTPSVLLEPLQREFGWSTATISIALSVQMAVFGMMAPFAAALMLRFGRPSPPQAALHPRKDLRQELSQADGCGGSISRIATSPSKRERPFN